MSDLLFPVAPHPSIAVKGEAKRFPVSRIFCVGRNYAEHAKEMGFEVDREAPFYFLKSATSIVHSGATIPYPPGTSNYHYEMEFVMAINGNAFKTTPERAMDIVYGYACGLDMTRRDLQISHREKGRPWDFGKDFENAAIISEITRASEFGAIGPQAISLAVNGAVKQNARLADLIWKAPEIISHLSRYYHLAPGDLIYTGTPAGVGAVKAGDKITGTIDGLAPIALTIGPAE